MYVRQVTILAAASVSSAIEFSDAEAQGEISLAAIGTSGSWDSADLGIQVSHDGVTYADLNNAAGTYQQLVVGADATVAYVFITIPSFKFIRFESQNSGTPQAQTAEETLRVLIVRRHIS